MSFSAAQFASRSVEETERFGRALGEVLEPGAVVALVGNLGAGKTRLVQAVAAGAWADVGEVNSPTFVLIQEYRGRLTLYHFDTYRLRDSDEFLELGADELLGGEGACLVEWADRVADVLPGDVLWIEIAVTGPTQRRFDVRATGESSQSLLVRLQHRLKQLTTDD